MVLSSWIALNCPEAYGRCKEMSTKLANEFPELTVVRGHYYDYLWGKREHWWCVTSDGRVFDPTAHQFPSMGKGRYERLAEGVPEPIGRCLECGDYCYTDCNFCCDDHRIAFTASLRN